MRGGGYFGGGGRERSSSRGRSKTDGGLEPPVSDRGLEGSSVSEGCLLELFPGEFFL